jgi:hypothetical protein
VAFWPPISLRISLADHAIAAVALPIERADNCLHAAERGVFGGSLEARLIFVSPKHPSGFGIDQVSLHANRAGDRLISRALAFGRIVSDPGLHLHSCIRAAVDEGRHFQPI